MGINVSYFLDYLVDEVLDNVDFVMCYFLLKSVILCLMNDVFIICVIGEENG